MDFPDFIDTAETKPVKRLNKKPLIILGSIIVVLFLILILTAFHPVKQVKYWIAKSYLKNEQYSDAYALFLDIGDFRDAQKYAGKFHYVWKQLTVSSDGTTVEKVDMNFDKKAGYLPTKVDFVYYYLSDSGTTYDQKTEMNLNLSYNDDGYLTAANGTGEYSDITESSTEYTTFSSQRSYNGGNLIQKIATEDCTYGTDTDSTTDIYNYTYDENGRLITEEEITDSGSTYSTDYIYDTDGNLIKEINKYDNNTTSSSWNYVYDTNNNLIKKTSSYGANTVYTYDTENRLIKEVYTVSLSPSNNTVTNYFYGLDGKLIKKTFSSGSNSYTQNYTYDADGYLVKETYSGDNSSYTVNYRYDKDHNLIRKTTVYDDDEGNGTAVFTYDKHGNLSKMTTTDSDGNTIVVTATYKLIYTDEDPLGITDYFLAPDSEEIMDGTFLDFVMYFLQEFSY